MSAAAALTLLAVLICGARAFAETEGVAIKTNVTGPTPAPAVSPDKIWSALVVATNAASPKDAPAELREFAPRLKRIFGYNQFELVGSATEIIDDKIESWLVPSQNFYLGVKARRAMSKEARGGYLLNLQLFQDKRPLVDTEAKLAPGSPLFIRGPQYGKGQLIIVLQVQR
jgi:hypothetical protein